ncbi:DNA-binding protein [Vibrio penaeicida]|uniref:DNA-binding protein n=1 Tax=Vibrio penaeicida TaxID=104609 RepID=UPI00273233F1|nr:DNA-binding protein [Vibrio penaeicida]MDP2571671.1 DNA-binding protein [Vibrio penaeicida]
MKPHNTFLIPTFTHEERVRNGRRGAIIAGYHPYSKDELAFVCASYGQLSFPAIAKRLGRSTTSVKTKITKLVKSGVLSHQPSRYSNPYSEVEERFIIDNQNRLSLLQVASRLGRSRESVKEKARKLGVSYMKIGEDSPVCNLTSSDVEMMRELNDLGLTYREIARKFEADESHVRKLCLFQTRLYQDKSDYLDAIRRQSSAIDARN